MNKFLIFCFSYFFTIIFSYGQFYGLPPSKLSLDNLSNFKPVKGNWKIVGDVNADPYKLADIHTATGKGMLVNIPGELGKDNIFTNMEHGDAEFEFEFMMPKGSNSGIYVQGRYEVQLFDSWGVADPTYADCGGIYARFVQTPTAGMQTIEGHAPRLNVSKAPGLWQVLHISFQAPKFDDKGVKISNAKFKKIMLNGVLIHDNIELNGPTGSAAFADEKPRGPIMIQGDHGPVAFRSIQYKLYDNPAVKLSNIQYKYFLKDSLVKSGKVDIIRVQELTDAVANRENLKSHFTYTGDINVINAGIYEFEVWAAGYQDLFIDNKDMKKQKGQIELSQGTHPFKLEYYREWYEPAFVRILSEGPNSTRAVISDVDLATTQGNSPTVLSNDKKEPVLQRSFNIHKGKMKTACISVGNSDKINYMLDMEKDALLKIWKGEFLDCSPMWIDRGSGETPVPLGAVIDLSGSTSLGVLENENAVWPDSLIGAESLKFIEYTLDKQGYPTFKYKLNNANISDQLLSEKNGQILTRQVKINYTQNIPKLYYRLAEGKNIKETSKGFYSIDDMSYYLNIKEFPDKPIIRTINNRDELIILLKNKDNKSSITYSIIW